jgi:hypothetical protein
MHSLNSLKPDLNFQTNRDSKKSQKVDRLQYVLKNRHMFKLTWVEPSNGYDAINNLITPTLNISASIDDCIAMQRYNIDETLKKENKPPLDESLKTEYNLLFTFIAINWAQIIQIKK